MYQSFRGGSNAQVPGAERPKWRLFRCVAAWRGRMRLTNYCEYEASFLSTCRSNYLFFSRYNVASYTERLARSANLRQFGINGQKRRGRKGGAKGPLIYISDYFICINDSRVLHYFCREYYISRIGQFCAGGAQTGALRPSMLLLPTDVK